MTIAHKNNHKDVEILIAMLVPLKDHNCFRKIPMTIWHKGIYLYNIMQKFQKYKSLFTCSYKGQSLERKS